jgi:hypothetical protein
MVATGPSLTLAQLEYVRPFVEAGKARIFGCNDVYKWCDFLDVFYFCDPRWYETNNSPETKPLPVGEYKCEQTWTQDAKAAPKYQINRVVGSGGKGLCKDKNKIHFGSNSGFQMINLAYHFGIRRFLLLGYNMDVPRGMQQHMFGPHPKPLNRAHNYKGFVSAYRGMTPADKAMIINCTFPTALDCFVQLALPEALPKELLDGTGKQVSNEAQQAIRKEPVEIHTRRREHGSSGPDQEAAKNAALSKRRNQALLARQRRRASRNRTKPNSRPTRNIAQATYGGPR